MANPLPQDAFSISERKIKFVELVGGGLTPQQAVKNIGYSSKKGQKDAVAKLLKDPWVMKELSLIQESNREDMAITREKVQSIVLEAIDMARTTADPMSIIRGAQELNKMCGFYAPEEKKVTLTAAQRRLTAKYDEISDEDLLNLISEQDKANAIEAEFEEIPDEDELPVVGSSFAERKPYNPTDG